MNKKLLFRLGLLFGFVLLISAAVIYFTFDIRTLEYLTMFEPRCILLASDNLGFGNRREADLSSDCECSSEQLLFGAGNAGCQRWRYCSGYVYA